MAARDVETLHMQIKQSSLMSLTTIAANGQPRSVVVWFAADKALNLVFMSRSTRRHCQELRADDRVSGTILRRAELTDKGPGSEVLGVMFRGAAIETSATAQEAAYAVYQARWPQVTDLAPLAEVRSGMSPIRFYSITPSEYTLFDEKYYKPIGEDPLRELREW
jgi:uncharacterized protein YhbP (UPF0306 family)